MTNNYDMFGIGDEDLQDQIDPPLTASGLHREPKQVEISNDNETRTQTEGDLVVNVPKVEGSNAVQVTGCTRFFTLDYYKKYFNIGENQVMTRFKAAIAIPISEDFLTIVNIRPDFYGPFWTLTTLIFLLSFVGNISNYLLSKFSEGEVWNDYFFKLEYIRYGFSFIYTYGIGVPVGLYFLFRFLDRSVTLELPQMICLYGYSLTPYLLATVLCIIPLSFLQWILLFAAAAMSTGFLFNNLKSHVLVGKEAVLGGIVSGVQILFTLVLKFTFLGLLS